MTSESDVPESVLRLNKYLAHCGICTRKEAVELIKQGLVTVNGAVELQPFREIQDEDVVTFRGKAVRMQTKYVYLLLNKPRKVPFASQDQDAETLTIQILLKKHTSQALLPATPTLDTTSGLVVMTNDHELIERLGKPDHKTKTIYLLSLAAELTDEQAKELRQVLTTEFGQQSGLDFPDLNNRSEVGIEVMSGSDSQLRHLFTEKGSEVLRIERHIFG
ncbi:MAG: pseudouridine synthase, partial [Saprospiraceae bacterium]|nr:pseudouridine synthase [Saprospiraceae bacterium]